ncbi:MAG: GNAT family N-acetyltransferase [Bacteroidetes Order II. Incertae sedis bacterium]|nr:GNAT family N-acetyltransferase [Bacteroidetes Order II. bacterium]
MGYSFVLRPATVSDATLLSQLAEQTFREAFEAIYDPEDCRRVIASSYNVPKLQNELADPHVHVWLAFSANEAIGYLQLEPDKRIPGVSGSRPLWLHRIYLKKAWTGQRVGRLLMEKALHYAEEQGHDVLWLTVWDQNPGAVRYYKRWGFRKTGYVNFPLGSENPPTDYLMQRDIGNIRVIPFHPDYRDAFAYLNYQWITHYFSVEAPDRAYLENPEKHILEKGGEIFFLLEDNIAVGTVAMIPSGPDEMELAKLAVIPEKQGRGWGKKLVEAGLDFARAKQARSVWLSTNSKLDTAINLYRKRGFLEEAVPENLGYMRVDLFMRLVFTESADSQ